MKELALGFLKEGFVNAVTTGASFEIDADARSQGGPGRLQGFEFVALRGVFVEESASGRVEGSGFAGFVRRGKDIEDDEVLVSSLRTNFVVLRRFTKSVKFQKCES